MTAESLVTVSMDVSRGPRVTATVDVSGSTPIVKALSVSTENGGGVSGSVAEYIALASTLANTADRLDAIPAQSFEVPTKTPSQRRFLPEDKARAVAEVRSGKLRSAVAAEFGTTLQSIREWIAKADEQEAEAGKPRKRVKADPEATPRRTYHKMPPADEVMAVHEQAGSTVGLADHFKVPPKTAQNWLTTIRKKNKEAAASS